MLSIKKLKLFQGMEGEGFNLDLGMLVRFEDMPKRDLLEEIEEFAPHLLEEAA